MLYKAASGVAVSLADRLVKSQAGLPMVSQLGSYLELASRDPHLSLGGDTMDVNSDMPQLV